MAKKETGEMLDEKSAKLKALQEAMSKIEKDFGKGSIMKLGEEKIENVDVLDFEKQPDGSLSRSNTREFKNDFYL